METSFFKRIQGWKTLGVNVLVMAMGGLTMAGVIDQGLGPAEIDQGVNNILGGAELILGGVNIFLRWITKTPLGQSE